MRTKAEIFETLLANALAGAEDNLYRFRMAARGRDTTAQWGESGRTLGELLAAAEAEVAELRAARVAK
jgi:hypothetical protein